MTPTTLPSALPADTSTHYKDLVDGLAILTECANRLASLETKIKDCYIDAVDEHRKEYAALQEALEKADNAVKDIAGLHPEWFADKKTITTPYGSIQSRSTTKLVVENETETIRLLKQLGPDAAVFVRTKEELDLEALEKLPDAELARILVTRVTTESLTAAPAKLNLGKAAKAAAKKAKQSPTEV